MVFNNQRLASMCGMNPYDPVFNQQEQMEDNGYTTLDTPSVAEKSDYVKMSESKQKHTPADSGEIGGNSPSPAEKEICHVCKKEKKPYIVFMNEDIFNYLVYEHAREKGPICERCDKYFAMTGELKEPTDKEFELAVQSRKFANKLFEWWTKDKELTEGDNSRDWEGIETIAKWFRDTNKK